MINQERPIVAAIHPSLARELKLRKDIIEKETNRPTKGGLTIFSQLAAEELKAMRESSTNLIKEIYKSSEIQVYKIEVEGTIREFVEYTSFKKLQIYCTALYKKKDNNQIRLEIQKIKGLKKNEVRFLW
jgi:hypothetical protein